MTDTTNRVLKLAYFALGIVLPVAGYLLWSKTDAFRAVSHKARRDKAVDIAVEASFPASDPPSAW